MENVQSGQSSKNSSLGKYTELRSPFGAITRTVTRFFLQRAAQQLLPDERTAACLRFIAPKWETHTDPATGKVSRVAVARHAVELKYSPKNNHARYQNPVLCGSPWGCPICAARISEHRAQELAKITNHPDYHTVLVTLTLRHGPGAKLITLLNALRGERGTKDRGAWGDMIQGKWWQEFKQDYAIVGYVIAIEITDGRNGWHPHLHVLFVCRGEYVDNDRAIEADLRRKYLVTLRKRGFDASWDNGVTVTSNQAHINEYVAKYDRLPADLTWTTEREIAKAVSKQARKGGKTPWHLLADYLQGDARAGLRFREYYAVMKGRHQLDYSNGLKALFGIDELTDEQIAESPDEDERDVLELNRDIYAELYKLELRGQLLDYTALVRGDRAQVEAWILANLGAVVHVDLGALMDLPPGEVSQAVTVTVIAEDQ